METDIKNIAELDAALKWYRIIKRYKKSELKDYYTMLEAYEKAISINNLAAEKVAEYKTGVIKIELCFNPVKAPIILRAGIAGSKVSEKSKTEFFICFQIETKNKSNIVVIEKWLTEAGEYFKEKLRITQNEIRILEKKINYCTSKQTELQSEIEDTLVPSSDFGLSPTINRELSIEQHIKIIVKEMEQKGITCIDQRGAKSLLAKRVRSVFNSCFSQQYTLYSHEDQEFSFAHKVFPLIKKSLKFKETDWSIEKFYNAMSK